MASLWRDGRPPTSSNEVVSERCEDVVIGAGITGLTTARLLVRAGRDVIVLEASDVGAVATGNTTAKVSLLQGTNSARCCASTRSTWSAPTSTPIALDRSGCWSTARSRESLYSDAPPSPMPRHGPRSSSGGG